MGIAIFLKFFNSNSHSHSNNFFFGIAIPIPILILELGFYESTTELGQLLISEYLRIKFNLNLNNLINTKVQSLNNRISLKFKIRCIPSLLGNKPIHTRYTFPFIIKLNF
jgi:hypothetical protein